MDSLTQIILGAAVGEVVLGKKIGNRALLWGAVGGTIPDLDVIGGQFLSNIDNLAFHRGISHSIFFAIVGAFVFGWLVHKLYQSKNHKWIAIVAFSVAAILISLAVNFVTQIFMPDNYLPFVVTLVLMGGLVFIISKFRYFSGKWQAPNATLRNWQWFFFWTVFTHPILDCFTMYGTQLFAPFSDYRVAWSTVSVVDPVYTAPFLICVIVTAFLHRTSKSRRVWNYAGITISSAYLLLTFINKQRMNTAFEKAIVKQNIQAERYISGPTILNNILWNATVETKDHFYFAQRSFFDEVPISFNRVDKNHDLIDGIDTDPTIKTLRWFSKDYFNVIKTDSALQLNDLRFGTFKGEAKSKDDYIFRFQLTKNAEGSYDMEEARGGPPKGGARGLFTELVGRIKGLKK